MKTSALRKAAKRRANGNGEKKKSVSKFTTRQKAQWKSGPAPTKPNLKDFRTRKPGEPFVTDWKAYQRAEMEYKRSQRGKTKKD